MLPMLVRFRIHDESKTFGFYLPMVLIYLLALPVVVLGAIVFAILLAVPETAKQARAYLRLIMALPQLLSASIGTEIDVQSESKDIVIRII